MYVIKVIMKAIDLKKPLVFRYFTDYDIAINHIKNHMDKNYKNYKLNWYNSHKLYVYEVLDYPNTSYWITFKLKKIKVCSGEV